MKIKADNDNNTGLASAQRRSAIRNAKKMPMLQEELLVQEEQDFLQQI